ncbi:MAG: hypothetical protein QM765_34675 [Myxococcales bacterium]
MKRSLAFAVAALVNLLPPGGAAAEEASAPATQALPATTPTSDSTPAAAPVAAPAETPEAQSAADESSSIGLSLDLGASTAYVFRGWNMFQKDSQWNPHAFLAPSITWTVGKTGLSLGYWGAYQFLGDNLGSVIDSGIGCESDLIVNYSHTLAGNLSGGVGFTAYLYPFAKKATAGTDVPTYLEPAIFLTFPTVVDLGLRVSYYHGVQDAVAAYRYVYINPTVGKTLTFNDRVALALAATLGYKQFIDTTTPTSKFNRFDVQVSAAVPITIAGGFYVKPGVSWAWTDIRGKPYSETMLVLGSLNLGINL